MRVDGDRVRCGGLPSEKCCDLQRDNFADVKDRSTRLGSDYDADIARRSLLGRRAAEASKKERPDSPQQIDSFHVAPLP